MYLLFLHLYIGFHIFPKVSTLVIIIVAMCAYLFSVVTCGLILSPQARFSSYQLICVAVAIKVWLTAFIAVNVKLN